jgi:hypothetical protein
MSRKHLRTAIRAALEPVREARLLGSSVDVESFQRFNAEAQERREGDKRGREKELSFLRAPERPACEKHGWGFPEDGRPIPPAHLCPECLAENLPETGEGSREIRVDADAPRHGNPHRHDQLARAEELLHQRRLESGQVEPGSEEERAALQYLADRRGAVVAADRKQRRGAPAWQHIGPDGSIVTGYHSARSRRAWKRQGGSWAEPTWPDIRQRLRIEQRQPLVDQQDNVIGWAEDGRRVG